MPEFILQPWPWYVAGPLIGLTVPLLLIFGNKHFGISANLRHICAICIPAKIPFFQYDWKHELWNLFFAAGITGGAFVAAQYLSHPGEVVVASETLQSLKALGVETDSQLMPVSIFGTDQIFTLKGILFMVFGGFLVGFGTRYAGGCTSGHSILGLSTLQWPSLVATCCFMAGGFLMVHVFYPLIFKLI